MKGLMMPFPLTLSHLVDRAERLFPSVEVVSRLEDHSLTRSTYGTVFQRARRLCAALLAEGIQPGDRVATLLWNNAANLETYIGVPMARGVLLPLNLRMQPAELLPILAQARPRWFIVDGLLWSLYEKIGHAGESWKVRVVGTAPSGPVGDVPDYETWISGFSPHPELPDLDENDACGLFFTTGTTGKSKGILYSHRSAVLHALAFALTFEMTQRDVVCLQVSMSHANGGGLPHATTIVGAKAVLPGPKPDAAALLGLFEREKVTFTGAVPQVWGDILDALDKEPDRWKLAPGFRCIVGGSALPEAMIRRFDRHRIRMTHVWGMTETGISIASTPKHHLESLPTEALVALRARQGLPEPFVELRTRSDPGLRVRDDGMEGELEVRGPFVARAYFGQSDPTDRWTSDGWFRTGDVASIDAEGYVQIVDRIGDLVKVGDEWASSVEVEKSIMEHPAVRDAAVVARVDPQSGERPHAVVVLRAGARAPVAELDRFLEGRVPDTWHPATYSFVESLPRTSVGKVSKQNLRQRLSEGTLETIPVKEPVRPPA